MHAAERLPGVNVPDWQLVEHRIRDLLRAVLRCSLRSNLLAPAYSDKGEEPSGAGMGICSRAGSAGLLECSRRAAPLTFPPA